MTHCVMHDSQFAFLKVICQALGTVQLGTVEQIEARMLGITAILIKSKTYNHVSGSQTVPRGTAIKVIPSLPSDGVDAVGSDTAERSGAFYGLHNGELFDLEPSDFRAVN